MHVSHNFGTQSITVTETISSQRYPCQQFYFNDYNSHNIVEFSKYFSSIMKSKSQNLAQIIRTWWLFETHKCVPPKGYLCLHFLGRVMRYFNPYKCMICESRCILGPAGVDCSHSVRNRILSPGKNANVTNFNQSIQSKE